MNNCCERALKLAFKALFICAKPKKFTDKLTDVKLCVNICSNVLCSLRGEFLRWKNK